MVKWLVLSRHGDGFGRDQGDFFLLEEAKFFEGGVVILEGGVDAALEAGEDLVLEVEGLTEGDIAVATANQAGSGFPELGFDEAIATEEPFGIDEGIDEHALDGGGGTEVVVVLVLEGFEVAGFFAGDDLGLGVDAGFQGIEGGSFLPFRSFRSSGFLGVGAIRVDLSLRCHYGRTITGELAGGGGWVAGGC